MIHSSFLILTSERHQEMTVYYVLCCRNITLLHYIITVLEKKYPKVVTFSEELQNVPEAAKVK